MVKSVALVVNIQALELVVVIVEANDGGATVAGNGSHGSTHTASHVLHAIYVVMNIVGSLGITYLVCV